MFQVSFQYLKQRSSSVPNLQCVQFDMYIYLTDVFWKIRNYLPNSYWFWLYVVQQLVKIKHYVYLSTFIFKKGWVKF